MEIVKRNASVCEGGNELLSIAVKYPRTEACPRIEEFYCRLADNAIEHCGKRIADIAKKSYEEDRNKGVRFVQYRYKLSSLPVYEGDRLCVIRTRAELCRGAERIEGMSFSELQWWEIEEGCMIAPHRALREYAEWQKDFSRIKKNSFVEIERGSVFLIKKDKREYVGELLPKRGENL